MSSSSENTDAEEPYQDSGSAYSPLSSESENNQSNPKHDKTFKPKKRVRKEKNWKRNKAKAKRLRGESFVNSVGTAVQPKVFENITCSCSNKCHLKISVDRQTLLFEEFYAMESYDLQTSYIYGMVDVVKKLRCYKHDANPSRRSYTRLYFLSKDNGEKCKVCKTFFKQVLKLSDGRISRILKSKENGSTPAADKRGRHTPSNKSSEEKIEEVKNYIKLFPSYQSHYSREKNPNRRFLAPDLSLGKIYNLYKSQYNEAVSYFVFSNIFNKEFNLHFHAPVSDSCKKCDSLKVKINATEDVNFKNQLITERDLHLRKAENAREGMKEDKILSKSDINITAIAFDLMKTLPTPVLSTGVAYYKRQLWTYCLGIHNLATGEGIMYVWDESLASRGPDEIGSCIINFVKNHVSTKKLIMYSDQCGGQNRNIKIAVLCNYIVNHPSFTVDEIDHKFLVSGHSYLPCDQDFGLIEKEKKFFRDIFLPKDWCEVIKSAKKKSPFKVISMTKTDFVSTATLMAQITNRKTSSARGKVEWLKMQWINFSKENPFILNYKYSNGRIVPFDNIDIKKRTATVLSMPAILTPLYPNGRSIDIKKKKDLLELSKYIPPIYHAFYDSLKTTDDPSDDGIIEFEEDQDQ